MAFQRSAWTDERLDDLAATLDTSVGELRDEIRGLRTEMREDFQGLREDFKGLREDLSAGQRQIAQIGWALAGTLVAALVALLISLA